MEKEISRATLKRLPTYLSVSEGAAVGGFGEHFGDGACRGLHMGEVQVRKDLALVSDGGDRKSATTANT